MRTFPLFDPKVYTFLFFKVKGGAEKDLISTIHREIRSLKGSKLDISFKEGWIVVEIMKEIMPDSVGERKISPDIFKLKYDEMNKIVKKTKDIITPVQRKEDEIFRYNLFTCGSKEAVWLQTYSDLSLFLDKDESIKERDQGKDIKCFSPNEIKPAEMFQSNVTYLNRIMNLRGEVLVNSLSHGKTLSYLYLLGKKTVKEPSPFPTDLLLEVNLGSIQERERYRDIPVPVTRVSPYGQSDGGEEQSYQMKQNYLISLLGIKTKLLDLFLIQVKFRELLNRGYKKALEDSSRLEDEIYDLQNDINSHMKVYMTGGLEQKGKGRKKDFLDRETFEREKKHLTMTSVRFSLISEIEHQIMRILSSIMDLEQQFKDIVRSLDLKSEVETQDLTPYSIGDITIREMEHAHRNLQSQAEELKHSREILSSTIEVLRTFIDTRQRETSEEMSRLMNLLFLVFACIGLADALGNFVIFVLEYRNFHDASWPEAVGPASLGMVLTLLPLLIAVIFIVLFFKKRR